MITKEEVLRLAALAHLKVRENELEKLMKDMDEIIAFADRINREVGDDPIMPFDESAVNMNDLREDNVEPSTDRERLFENGSTAHGLFCMEVSI